MIKDEILAKLKFVPKKPGCYLWKNINGNVIYVGKAKNLFNRMHQYFDNNKDSKTSQLVKNIADFDYFIVDNVNEALILENNLIKKYYPKFNILLKDTSDYPYIVLTNDKNPKLIYTHKYQSIKGKYYGPIADSSLKSYDVYKILLEISPFNKHGFNHFNSNLYKDKNPDQVFEIWKKYLDDIFNGKVSELQENIIIWEKQAANLLNFEEAKKFHDIYVALDKIASSQLVQFNLNKYADYVSFYIKESFISIIIFSYIDGKLLNKHSFIHEIYQDDIEDILSNYLIQYYSINKIPKKIFISLSDELLNNLSEILDTNVCYPLNDFDKNIMNLSLENAKDYYQRNINISKLKYDYSIDIYEKLLEITGLKNIYQMDVIDISNNNNEDPIAGVIVYINGKPIKKMYRKYNLDTINGIGDYNFMKQAIYKRYNFMLNHNEKLPQLLIVDGGEIQVNAALTSLNELNIDSIKVIGLKKDDNHKTNSIVVDDKDIKLDKKSHLYLYLLNIQEEVHRWAITNFRSKNIKNKFVSFFKDIKGMGNERTRKLLNKYPTLKDIYYANDIELEQIIPKKIIKDIKEKIKNEFNI